MNSNSMKINVPMDSGFASGGGAVTNLLMRITSVLSWVFSPREAYRDLQKQKECLRRFEGENVRLGRNKDGSIDFYLPKNIPLHEALRRMGFEPDDAERSEVYKKYKDTPIEQVSSADIQEIIVSCQIANW
jgi:hypothetical protein